jgi:hypothetical protein
MLLELLYATLISVFYLRGLGVMVPAGRADAAAMPRAGAVR